MSVFEQFGFSDPTQTIIRNSIGGNISEIADNVIPGYFIGQMCSAVVWGRYSRKTATSQMESSINFRKQMMNTNIDNAKEQTLNEIKFMRECHTLGMQRQIEYAKKSCEDRIKEEEFRKFCEGTWLKHFRPTIGAILEEFRHPQIDSDGVMKMKLMIARTKYSSGTYLMDMDKAGAYYDFCSDLKDDYSINQSFDGQWLRAWQKECVSPVADTMNLHYIMQGLPTILIFPMKRGKMLSIEVSTWAFQTGQSNMSIDKVFQIPISELSNHPNRLQNAMIAAAAYTDDCYRLFFCQNKPASIHQVANEIKKDSLVWDLLCHKYKSLLNPTNLTSILKYSTSNEIKKLENTIEL